MNTYKVTTTTGYFEYIGSSMEPQEFANEKMGFDYDGFNSRCPSLNNPGHGVINSVELFWCDTEQKQVRRMLAKSA